MSEPKRTQPVFLSLHNKGNTEFSRFVISDQYLRYWTGTDWSIQNDEDAALVYANAHAALEDMDQLLMMSYGKKPKSKYVAPLYIDLYSDQKVSKKQLRSWLVKVTKLIMDTTKHGNGPLQGSYGSCRIEFGEMQELK